MNNDQNHEDKSFRLAEASRFVSLHLQIPVMIGNCDSFPFDEFYQRSVFAEQVQVCYQTDYLSSVSNSSHRHIVRMIDDPLGTHCIQILAEKMLVIFGPFVTESYSEKLSRKLLADHFRYDSYLQLQFKYYWCRMSICSLDEVMHSVQSVLQFSGYFPEDFLIVNSSSQTDKPAVPANTDSISNLQLNEFKKVEERYLTETELTQQIAAGNEQAAVAALKKILLNSRPQSGLAVDLWSHESASAIVRSIIRLAAKNSGLNAVVIDGISLEYAQKMRKVYNNPKEAARLYIRMISDLCREITAVKENRLSPLVQRALYVIRSQYAEPLSVKRLSELLNVSESTLSRNLKAETGQSFTWLIKKERMTAAARLIIHSGKSIQEIAEKVGIPDQNYFVKVFRSVYHMTPTEYRNLSLFS